MATTKRAAATHAVSYHEDSASSEDEFLHNDTRQTSSAMKENAIPAKRKGVKSIIADGADVGGDKKRRKSLDNVPAAKSERAVKKLTKRSRAALADISNAPNNGEDGDVDDFVAPGVTAAPKKRGRPAKSAAEQNDDMEVEKPKVRKARGTKDKDERAGREENEMRDVQVEHVEEPVKSAATKPAAKTSKAGKMIPTVIPETQPEMMDVAAEDKVPEMPHDAEVHDQAFERMTYRPTSTLPLPSRRRGGSASDTERGSDILLKKKLSDVTRKFEALNVKHLELKQIGVDEAGENFEKLKRLADEKTKASQAAAAKELAAARSQIAKMTVQHEKTVAERKQLQTDLLEAQAEVKALQTKLSATRASSATIQSTESLSKIPGSAVKKGQPPRTVLVGSAEAAKEAQKRAMKEELYSDLTGLVVLDVKRREAECEDIYDCIQTGRNGSKCLNACQSALTL
ncbi:hypothetical protein MRB53_038791 [Persea americana]|nr:hypothetical protein MRB53_038791 [Persea americana]